MDSSPPLIEVGFERARVGAAFTEVTFVFFTKTFCGFPVGDAALAANPLPAGTRAPNATLATSDNSNFDILAIASP
nr:hypothetical protein [Acetobacter malorum]